MWTKFRIGMQWKSVSANLIQLHFSILIVAHLENI